jgi:hypothetical protein
VADTSEEGTEALGSIAGREFPEQIRSYKLLKKRFACYAGQLEN